MGVFISETPACLNNTSRRAAQKNRSFPVRNTLKEVHLCMLCTGKTRTDLDIKHCCFWFWGGEGIDCRTSLQIVSKRVKTSAWRGRMGPQEISGPVAFLA